ncbi:uncharacterized protein [Macrobrachium rosenbergii]|uniref:uncharacterized protein n=1 Tax=Macrobrachium rosenbergii TaxID=79674 RepID=UPI0034D78597
MTAATIISRLTKLFSTFGLPNYVHSDRGASFMSSELKSFFLKHGVATSRSTPYHPTGNAQCERFVGTVWKSVMLALKSCDLPPTAWEMVLDDALHSIRTLLSTATGETPHERMFIFQRKTSSGMSLPTWLCESGTVLLRRHVRRKEDPLVEEVQLLEANPSYAHVRFEDGREDTVAISDLARCPRAVPPPPGTGKTQLEDEVESVNKEDASETQNLERSICDDVTNSNNDDKLSVAPRRSQRIRRPVDRLNYN